jgi:hypothetical protein
MKKFIEFLKEQENKVSTSEIKEVDVVPTAQESEQKNEKNWNKVVKEFKNTVKQPSYSATKKFIQGDKKSSEGAIELDLTPKPKIEAPLPQPETPSTT